jgi:dTMP kinase
MFITIEGPDGSGKSTLARKIEAHLIQKGHTVVLTREPGDGPSGEAIRNVLLQSKSLDPWTEAFLFLADRRQHCLSVIGPALASGAIVVCDRFADSTIAYQGYGRSLPLPLLKELNTVASCGYLPDLTLLLDIAPQTALDRLAGKDRLDREPLAFHERVREGFLTESRLDVERWRVIDASGDEQAVAAAALHAIASRLPCREPARTPES